MKKNRYLALIIAIGLSGCASLSSKPYIASQEDLDYYFANQKLKVNSGVVHHADLGEVPYSNENYVRDYDKCLNEAFSGKSFQFGNRSVSAPKVLKQMSNDNTYLFLQAYFKPQSNIFNKPENKVFKDKTVLSTLKKVSPYLSETLDCVKYKGWSFPSKK
jgi:hypothetical protein